MILGIFSDIKKGSSLNVYESVFNQTSDQTYKDYLYNEYIIHNKTKDEIANYLGTKQGTISTHLTKYDIKKDVLIQDDSKVYNKTPSMIEKETGRKFVDIYNELIEQGMSLTEITAHLKIKRIGAVSSFLYYERIKQRQQEIGDSNLIIKGLKGKNPTTLEKEFIKQLGITYKDFLKQKYIDEGLTVHDIEELIGISARRISDRIKYYGFNKTQSEARKTSIEKGRIDYNEVTKKSRGSRIKSSFGGSSKQDIFRELLKHYFESITNYFPNIEIITGYNEYSVLYNLEIDIPIIIFYQNHIIKVAIEYDGEIWHEDRETDLEKEITLKGKGWHLIRIKEAEGDSPNLTLVEDRAINTINEIKQILMNL